MSLSTWIQMSPRMKPGLESARLVAQLSHIQAIPHHGHKQLLVPTSSKKKEINIVLLQVFLRDPKEPHGHKMASLLHQDINDLSYEILVPLSGLIVMKVHWVLVMIWAGGGWVRAVLLCQSPVLETSFFFFFPNQSFVLATCKLFFPWKNVRVTKTLSFTKLWSGRLFWAPFWTKPWPWASITMSAELGLSKSPAKSV